MQTVILPQCLRVETRLPSSRVEPTVFPVQFSSANLPSPTNTVAFPSGTAIPTFRADASYELKKRQASTSALPPTVSFANTIPTAVTNLAWDVIPTRYTTALSTVTVTVTYGEVVLPTGIPFCGGREDHAGIGQVPDYMLGDRTPGGSVEINSGQRRHASSHTKLLSCLLLALTLSIWA